MKPVGQTWRERYGDTPMKTDGADDCPHETAQLMYVGAALEEWYCYDCQKRVRVWSPSP